MLQTAGHLEEAWEYSRLQVKYIPNVVTYITASWILYQRSCFEPDVQLKEGAVSQQLNCAKAALAEFEGSPESIRNNRDIRGYMALCLSTQAVSLKLRSDADGARAAMDHAIDINPHDNGLLRLRELVLNSTENSDLADSIVYIQSLLTKNFHALTVAMSQQLAHYLNA